MEQKIPCEIIKDLLPLYVDGLTSEYSSKEIDNHLQECRDCKERFDDLQTNLGSDNQNNSEKEIDYLKKINRNQKRNIILGSVISFLIGASIPILKYKTFILVALFSGGKLPAYQVARLKVMWPQIVAIMVISGLVVLVLFFVIKFILKKIKSK
jgi:hypothetical protein